MLATTMTAGLIIGLYAAGAYLVGFFIGRWSKR